MGDLSKQFETEMRAIYPQCAKFGYHPTYLLQLISDYGGVGAAKHLLGSPPSDGFSRLALEQRLDLSVEAVVLKPQWQVLFDEAELTTARRRLKGTPYAG
jgi:hypothetical protein